MARKLACMLLGMTLAVPLAVHAQYRGGSRGAVAGRPGPVIGRAPLPAPVRPGIGMRPAFSHFPRFNGPRIVSPIIAPVIIPPFGYYSPFYSGLPVYEPSMYGTPNYTGPLYPASPAESPVYYGSSPTAQQSPDIELARKIQELTDEVQRLRAEDAARRPAAQPAETPQQPSTPVVLIFRDGHRQETQSYAVTGQTLWILDAQGSSKVSLSDLDLDATRKENRQRGVTFLPGL